MLSTMEDRRERLEDSGDSLAPGNETNGPLNALHSCFVAYCLFREGELWLFTFSLVHHGCSGMVSRGRPRLRRRLPVILVSGHLYKHTWPVTVQKLNVHYILLNKTGISFTFHHREVFLERAAVCYEASWLLSCSQLINTSQQTHHDTSWSHRHVQMFRDGVRGFLGVLPRSAYTELFNVKVMGWGSVWCLLLLVQRLQQLL